MLTAPKDLAGLARLIQSPECQSIVFLTGAGVSVAADIPDFRSPGGFYDTLRPELITASALHRRWMAADPTAVVNWDVFSENSLPYLEVRRPFILGTRHQQWKATLAHHFFEQLHVQTGKLTRLYTQNIDGLDFQRPGLPADKIVPVHGSIATASCEGCGASMDFGEFCNKVETQVKDIYQGVQQPASTTTSPPASSTPIVCPACQQPLVKPDTVLFGRQLPERFFESIQTDLPKADLLIVAGTSLTVSPANMLVDWVPPSAVRVLVNREAVGVFDEGKSQRDYMALGSCDQVFLELMEHLGWTDHIDLDVLPPQSAALLRASREKQQQQT